MPVVKVVCVVFIEFIRGVPLITLLFVASTDAELLPAAGNHFDLLLRVLIMVTLFSAAYIAEVIRGGLQAIPKGQYEAADAHGPEILAVDAADHPAAGAEDLDPRHRQHLHRPVQGHDAGGHHRPVRPARHRPRVLADTKWQGLSTEVYVFVAIFFFIFCFGMSRYAVSGEEAAYRTLTGKE